YVGQTTSVTVIASTHGVLNAWLDLQGNGTWTDAVDQVFVNVNLSAGPNVLALAIPANATVGDTFARFRFSTISNLTIFGEAPNGEVEDYRVTIRAASDLALGVDPGSAAVPTGSDIACTVRITNNGPSVAHNVVLTNVLPPNATFISATSSVAACSQDSGGVTCTIPALSNGGPTQVVATLNFVIHPLSPGFYTNRFGVRADEADLLPQNNSLSKVSIVQ